MKRKIYSPNQVLAAAFLGGPMAMVYVLWKNFQALENPHGLGDNSTGVGRRCRPSQARLKTSMRGGCSSWSTNSKSRFVSKTKRAARKPSFSSTSWCAAAINRRHPAQIPPPPGDQGATIHVVATMRSEFLGECARFNGLAEAVNRTQYLVPRMDREGLMRAIRRPALLYGGEVRLDLAERLIADVGGREDKLPLIQHGLMYMWNTAAAATPPGGKIILDTDLLEAAGGLSHLLSGHADAIVDEAAPDPERLWRQSRTHRRHTRCRLLIRA